MAPSPDPTPIHVLVCCFGLWGESKHLHALTDLILEQWKQRESTKTSNPSEFKLLIPDVNASMKTLDGVDLVCLSFLFEPQH